MKDEVARVEKLETLRMAVGMIHEALFLAFMATNLEVKAMIDDLQATESAISQAENATF